MHACMHGYTGQSQSAWHWIDFISDNEPAECAKQAVLLVPSYLVVVMEVGLLTRQS